MAPTAPKVPVFIRGDVTLKIGDNDLIFPSRQISLFGVTDLKWPIDDPIGAFAPPFRTLLRIHAPAQTRIETASLLVRERSEQGRHFRLRFLFEPGQRLALAELIRRHGFAPPQYARAIPRIPSVYPIDAYPHHVLVTRMDREASGTLQDPLPIIAEVLDMSPKSIFISSDAPQTVAFEIRTPVEIEIQNDQIKTPIRLAGRVRRIFEEHGIAGQRRRFLAIEICEQNPVIREEFKALIRKIVLRIREQMKK